ncbi:DgyrCDS10638 [Dimorphilus gyrociliatus]|uniref:DgyrCDS10638 n=1 Tax=Dimorphilus gyrociliatus TaxID=2664684 RepID=A0A7I8W0W3_9ANNE|nr:DgyrCDS10638 [Dimorphilus gyrociliatus]
MKYEKTITFCVLLSFILVLDAVDLTPLMKITKKCDSCKKIVEKFYEGLKKTNKANFGGGNTAWEEKSLGKFFFSETRLYEITDSIYQSSDSETASMLGEYEEDVEVWWKEHYSKKKDHINLLEYICINKIKVCCPNGTFGENCQPCVGGSEKPCNGNGKCEGDGTRGGSGDCECKEGYLGNLCDTCAPKFYRVLKEDTEENSQQPLECKACHESCKDNCTGPGPNLCFRCKPGWNFDEEDGVGCVDIDECAEDSPCKDDEYCNNKPGSHSCEKCHEHCKDCTGPGAIACKQCAPLHFRDENTLECSPCHPGCANSCTGKEANKCDACKEEGWKFNEENKNCDDVDECEKESACSENEYCLNTFGSFACHKCHKACQKCSKDGIENCLTCASGYEKNENDTTCQDIDECSLENGPCKDSNEDCLNTVGSFTCECKKNFERKDGKCLQKNSQKKKKRKTKKVKKVEVNKDNLAEENLESEKNKDEL